MTTIDELTVIEETVLSLLGKGKANAKPSRQIIGELQALGIDLGSDPTRELRNVMHQLRLKGFPICASNDVIAGYFVAETPDELFDYIQREINRLREQAKPIAVLKRIYRNWINEQIQHRLTVLTDEGRQFLESLISDEDIAYIRKFPDKAAQKIYARAFLVKTKELQDFIGDKALDWLKSQGITEEAVKEFIKEVLMR